jgi:DNA-binding PadR family transcriptional regulator
MSEALSIRQGTLTKVLSRLVAAKVVEVDRRHVHGQSRRLNVYRLTALGESVARDIRVRHAAEQSDAVVMVPK